MQLRLMTAVLTALVLAPSVFARRQETLIRGRVDHGYFGGMVAKFTTVNDKMEVMLGGRGGWIIDHTFSLGLAGYGLVTTVRDDFELDGRPIRVDFGYGGVELAYIGNSDRLIHYEFTTLIGGGAMHYFGTHGEEEPQDDGFFVLEPGASAVLNITTFCRATVGVSYRWVSAVDFEEALSSREMSGPSVSLGMNFGVF
jgi:hypothetical protein